MGSFKIADTKHLYDFLIRLSSQNMGRISFNDGFPIPGNRRIESGLIFDGAYYALFFHAQTPYVSDMEEFQRNLNRAMTLAKKASDLKGKGLLTVRFHKVRTGLFYLSTEGSAEYQYRLGILGREGEYSIQLIGGTQGTSAQSISSELEFTENVNTLEGIANRLFHPILASHSFSESHDFSLNLLI